MGSSLAGFFGVFHRLLAARLKEAAQADGRQLQGLCDQLKVGSTPCGPESGQWWLAMAACLPAA